MFDDVIGIFKTEDLYETYIYQDSNGAGIDLTSATFNNWVRQSASGADTITNANITVTLANQVTNAGQFTVFIDRTQYASLEGNYIFRITITLSAIDYTIYNAKLCINA